MITTFLVILHVIVSIILIVVVLMQSGKGGELSTAFGGGETLFGTRAGTFFTKLTTILAIVFMVTSLTLAVVTSKGLGPLGQ
jgi:preprotein translocase subunit SecG